MLLIGAVLHSHAICCNLVTSMFEGESEFKISHQEMIKGIKGYGTILDMDVLFNRDLQNRIKHHACKIIYEVYINFDASLFI